MEQVAAYVGWDWADREHVLSLREGSGKPIESSRVGGRSEQLHGWAAEMLSRFGGQKVAVAIDAGRGAVISAFMGYPHLVLYPVNPKAAASLREALYPSGKKDDPVDSEILLEMVEKHGDRIRPLNPADALTRELGILSEDRKRFDDDRKRTVNRLRDALKSFYPQANELFGDLSSPMVCAFLTRWPSLENLQRAREASIVKFFHEHGSRSKRKIEQRLELIREARPLTSDVALLRSGMQRVRAFVKVIRTLIETINELDQVIEDGYRAHAEHDLINSFPGLGAVLGPRVAAVLGSDRSRWESAESLQRISGVAPVTCRTGGKDGPISVHRRVRRPKFMHQTFVEWAGCSIAFSPWARAYYEMRKEKDPTLRRYVILRALASKWLSILWRCWIEGTHYDAAAYERTLALRGSPLANRLAKMAA